MYCDALQLCGPRGGHSGEERSTSTASTASESSAEFSCSSPGTEPAAPAPVQFSTSPPRGPDVRCPPVRRSLSPAPLAAAAAASSAAPAQLFPGLRSPCAALVAGPVSGQHSSSLGDLSRIEAGAGAGDNVGERRGSCKKTISPR